MDSTTEVKPTEQKSTRRPRRSKADIEEAILKAAVAQIKRKGFSLSLVTDIVKKAKIEPIVFYNRYKNLEEFYDEFVKKYDYWLSDFARSRMDGAQVPEERYGRIMSDLFEALMADAVMAEVLRWEIAEGNHITERTARVRELHARDMFAQIAGVTPELEEIDAPAITAILIAGIFYMILHKDRSTFGGIDINTPEGRGRVFKACGRVGEMMYGRGRSETERRVAERLREQGVAEDVIEKALAH